MTGDEERAAVHAADGRLLLTYLPGTDGGRPFAFDARPEPGSDLDDVADALVRQLAGHGVSGPEDLGDRLAARGAQVRRRLTRMYRPLDTDPPPAAWAAADLGPGRSDVPVTDRDPRDILPAWFAAYSRPGHPDSHPGTAAEACTERLVPLLDGTEGPVLPWSRLAVDADGRVRAGVVGIAVPELGAVIGDVFRDPAPDAAGLGTALLRRVVAVAARDGVPRLHLAVTDGNPAVRVYARLGFVPSGRFANVLVSGP